MLTAIMIQSRDDIEVSAGGPAENGKYVGWITLGENNYYRPLLNSQPIYDSLEEAKKEMQKVVDDIRSKAVVALPEPQDNDI